MDDQALNLAPSLSSQLMDVDRPTIQIFGMGYIGLPTAAVMARAGFRVLGVDVLERVVNTINGGSIHISEVGLEDVVRDGITSGLLSASTQPQSSEVHIIAVPTPINQDKSPDISFVVSATRAICSVLKKGDLVILESTVPPFTCEGTIRPLIKEITGLEDITDYSLVHCPERVIPGKILHELVYNDRIIGGTDERATDRASVIYGSFVKGSILKTSATAAELCKLMENTYRDVNIALANEFESISNTLGVDVFEAISLANHHPRVNIHTPSIGVGGHCIPVDPWFIVSSAPSQSRIIKLARMINDEKPLVVAQRIRDISERNGFKSIAILGLAYKPNVDDIRDSPSFEILKVLGGYQNLTVYSADPLIEGEYIRNKKIDGIRFITTDEAVELADAVFILVGHSVFDALEWKLGQKVYLAYNGFVTINS